jgi:hypothetical protein
LEAHHGKYCGRTTQGRIQDFKLGEAHLKKLRRAEGGTKNVGVFRLKNHDFTSNNHIFSNFRGRGGAWIRPCNLHNVSMGFKLSSIYKLQMTSQVDKFVHKETEWHTILFYSPYDLATPLCIYYCYIYN